MLSQSNIQGSPQAQARAPHSKYGKPASYNNSKLKTALRSPQSSAKQNNYTFSTSNSPLPIQSHSQLSFQKLGKQPSKNQSSTNHKIELQYQASSQKHNQKSRVVPNKASKTINSVQSPSCLQIDLSNFSYKNDMETFQAYGQQVTNKQRANKQPSAHSLKKTPTITASSPTYEKQISCKSPTIAKSESLLLKKSFKDTTKKSIVSKQSRNLDERNSTFKKSTNEVLDTDKNSKPFTFQQTESPPQIAKQPTETEGKSDAPYVQAFKSEKDSKHETLSDVYEILKQEESAHGSEDEFSLPIKKEKFVDKFAQKLFNFELEEIKDLKVDKLYFVGQTLSRTQTELQMLKEQHESQLIKEFDDEEGYYNVLLSDHLIYRYEILKILGKGSFAQVVSCIDHVTGKKVAIKITRNTEIDHKFANSESKLLNYLMEHDPNDSFNVVRLLDEFSFREHHCFVFELLNTDLFEHLKSNDFLGFPTGKIREYATQLLEALIFLEDHKIIHCDLKPENILLTDSKCEKLKLVDYGSGCFVNEQVYTYVQSRFYRAPEVILRLAYNEKVDIWSFGCILAELYTGEPLFPGNDEQEQLELIMEVCGIPPSHVIDKSRKKAHYFDTDYSPFLVEDDEMGILRIPDSKSLNSAVPCQDPLFVEFVKKCIELDPSKRFSAKEAIQHPWISQGLKSASPLYNQSVMNRQREEDCAGVKNNAVEESPERPAQEPPKKSLSKIFNFGPIQVDVADENVSMGSTPRSEGNPPLQSDVPSNVDTRFKIIEQEPIKEEPEIKKPHNHAKMIEHSKLGEENVKLLGKVLQTTFPQPWLLQYEIVRDDNQQSPKFEATTAPGTAEIENKQRQKDQDSINNENAINKITITVYQRRQHMPSQNSKKSK